MGDFSLPWWSMYRRRRWRRLRCWTSDLLMRRCFAILSLACWSPCSLLTSFTAAWRRGSWCFLGLWDTLLRRALVAVQNCVPEIFCSFAGARIRTSGARRWLPRRHAVPRWSVFRFQCSFAGTSWKKSSRKEERYAMLSAPLLTV